MRPTLSILSILLALAPPALGQSAPLNLNDALRALPNSPDWQSADLAYESALRSLEAAQAAAGFKLTASGSYTLSQSNTLILSSTASLGVLPWSPTQDAIHSAQRALERAALTRRDARNTLYINLVTQYFNLRQAASDLAIAQATLALRERQLQVTQARNQAGSATLSDVLEAQQNLDTARSNLVSATATLEIARLALAGTLGVNPQSLGQPATPPSEPELPSGTLEALVQQAYARRSDVLKAQSQLQDAQESLAAAQRDRLLPDASLSVGYGGSTSSGAASVSAGLSLKSGTASISGTLPAVSSASSSQSPAWSLNLSASFPVFDPVSEAKIRSAQTALDAAQQALESARRAAELDVRQKYQALLTAKSSVAAAKTALEAANQNLRTAQARLEAGTGTALDLQAAQVNQQQASRNLEAATAQAQLAALALQNALGTDLTQEKSP
ncbi:MULTISPECIES: TolC family protein [unclassified Meiothermus]|uniref:TolC family protein n=1 Tax=unclassified Meiothermus TaxID=370471 RepID=UPI000D7CCB87|nr:MULTISPECIES: TolC family protein [unclassified Meiothermus]PZA08506.1 TolC family protein [Meiothermus sp. Pnk-1]RYM36889.1 TolC family protein [Meiothermus sp. PNK-Is4]